MRLWVIEVVDSYGARFILVFVVVDCSLTGGAIPSGPAQCLRRPEQGAIKLTQVCSGAHPALKFAAYRLDFSASPKGDCVMKPRTKLLFASAIVSLAFGVPAAELVQQPSTGTADMQRQRVAETAASIHQHQLDFVAAPIKSADDLQAYLAMMPKALSPFEKLSPGAKRRFLNGLVFNENGLVGYDYSDLAAELPASDVYRLMSLFGAQRTVPLISGLIVEARQDAIVTETAEMPMDDHVNYRCIGGHNCIYTGGMICMTGC